MSGRFFLTLLDLLRLRSGPQDMPSGWLFAAVLSIAYITQGFITERIFVESDGAPRSLLAVGLQFSIIAIILKFRNLQTRLPQTLSALAATGFIFGLLSILILSRVDPAKTQPDLILLYFGIFGWSLAVDAHIYRQSLSVKMGIGVLLAVLIFAANYILLRSVAG